MARVQTVAGYTVRQYTSPNVDGKMTAHRGVVLHIAEGGYEGTISWQMNPDQRYSNGKSVTTSSTWIVGREVGQVAQMCDSGTVAWCQRDGSFDWNSIELAGFSTQAPTAWQREACAHLFAWAHGLFGFPLQVADHPGELGLGHHSMDREWPPYNEEWGHEQCPGAGVIAAKPAIVARAIEIVNGGDDMPTAEEIADAVWGRMDPAKDTNMAGAMHEAHARAASAYAQAKYNSAQLDAIARAVQADDDVDELALAAALAAPLAERVIAALPGSTEGLTQEQIEQAVRNAFADAFAPQS